MRERPKRASRLVQALARWAITLGAAGTVAGATALYGVLTRQEVVTSRQNLLLLSATLLSMAFVLAPFVRNTFSPETSDSIKRTRPAPRTLLDEMQEKPHAASAPEPAESAIAEPEDEASATAVSSLTARLIAGVYVIFGAMLLAILWALQS